MKKLIYLKLACVALFLNCNVKSEPSLFGSTAKSLFAVGENPNDIALGDVNGDGKKDIVEANARDNNVTVLLAG